MSLDRNSPKSTSFRCPPEVNLTEKMKISQQHGDYVIEDNEEHMYKAVFWRENVTWYVIFFSHPLCLETPENRQARWTSPARLEELVPLGSTTVPLRNIRKTWCEMSHNRGTLIVGGLLRISGHLFVYVGNLIGRCITAVTIVVTIFCWVLIRLVQFSSIVVSSLYHLDMEENWRKRYLEN